MTNGRSVASEGLVLTESLLTDDQMVNTQLKQASLHVSVARISLQLAPRSGEK